MMICPVQSDFFICSEYDSNLKIYSTAYPWLFPGADVSKISMLAQ